MKQLLLLAVILVLTACSTPPPRQSVADPEKTWQERKLTLAAINDWFLQGRVAIVNSDEAWHLSMNWQRHADKYILDLSGPFGAGHAQLTGSADGVMLLDADKNYFYADSPDRLLYETTHLRMPVKSLLYWMRGLPDRELKKEQHVLDAYGRLAQLQQDGWRVRFRSYVDIDKHELPQKIFIDGHHLTVKIFIDEWDLKSKTFISKKE
ncbi:MAG: lipoprotein insertase outer membrane protein LolB [Gammaproteobacteria bacterium]|nr:lipoprotein insertase outer membrane protein LolB [Gammaproteobacteria bacterium]